MLNSLMLSLLKSVIIGHTKKKNGDFIIFRTIFSLLKFKMYLRVLVILQVRPELKMVEKHWFI